MNKGIAMATGDWIGWLNSDDYYLPGAFNAVATAVESNPDARWIVGKCRIIDADDHEIRSAITAYKNWLLRHYSFRLYLTQNFVSCPSTFVRKDAYEAVGPLDPRYRISMDYDVFLRIARRWDPVVLDRELAVFRMEEGTLSIEGFEEQFVEHAEQARRHGAGHPLPVTANQVISRGIVLVYRLLGGLRGWPGYQPQRAAAPPRPLPSDWLLYRLDVTHSLLEEGQALREHLRLVGQPRHGHREVEEQQEDEREGDEEERGGRVFDPYEPAASSSSPRKLDRMSSTTPLSSHRSA